MSEKIFTDPHTVLTFHDVVTDARSGMSVYLNFMDRTERPANSLSYPHFMVMLKSGSFTARDLKPLCQAMLDCNLDPEPCLMAMYADCLPLTEPCNGSLDDEFCGVVSSLSGIAEQVRSGQPLRDLARRNIVELNDVVARICSAARHMSRELVSALRTEAA